MHLTFCVYTQGVLLTIKLNRIEELIAKLQEKAQACGYKTKEDRARKGAYVDCIMELKEALRIHDVIERSEQLVCDLCNQPYTKEELKVGHCFNCGEQDF